MGAVRLNSFWVELRITVSPLDSYPSLMKGKNPRNAKGKGIPATGVSVGVTITSSVNVLVCTLAVLSWFKSCYMF